MRVCMRARPFFPMHEHVKSTHVNHLYILHTCVYVQMYTQIYRLGYVYCLYVILFWLRGVQNSTAIIKVFISAQEKYYCMLIQCLR